MSNDQLEQADDSLLPLLFIHSPPLIGYKVHNHPTHEQNMEIMNDVGSSWMKICDKF